MLVKVIVRLAVGKLSTDNGTYEQRQKQKGQQQGHISENIIIVAHSKNYIYYNYQKEVEA